MSSFVQIDEFDRLLERIRSNDGSLRVVNLACRRIGDDGRRRLAVVLWGNTIVTSLLLGYNDIGPEGATALAGAIEGNSTLTLLGLGNNDIGPAGAAALAGALEVNASLTWLGLSSNSIGPAGAAALAGALEVNASLTLLGLEYNSIGPAGATALAGVLEVNTSLTGLDLEENNVGPLRAKVERLVEINEVAPSPQEAHRLKIECRIGWMLLDSEDDGEEEEEEDYDSEDDGGEEEEEEANYEGAVSLALDELDSFPQAGRRRQLFEKLLGSTERGEQVAASVDVERGRALYWYAAECGASPVVMMNVLKAHPSLSSCRDIKRKLYPFMLLSTLEAAGVGEVLELLLMAPNLVKSGINGQATEEGSED